MLGAWLMLFNCLSSLSLAHYCCHPIKKIDLTTPMCPCRGNTKTWVLIALGLLLAWARYFSSNEDSIILQLTDLKSALRGMNDEYCKVTIFI